MTSIPPLQLALAALLVPLAAALVIAVVRPLRNRGKPAAGLSVGAALVSLLAAIALLVGQLGPSAQPIREVVAWLPRGAGTLAHVGVELDGISASMLVIVTLVASCVQIFSLSYMAQEPMPAYGRYFGLHSLFIFSMNLLVLAPNLLQLFAGWELVGLTSYLLIGFYFRKPSAGHAAVKAFWVTKFADMGLMLGLLLLVAQTGSFDWTLQPGQLDAGWATAITMLLFVGVMGKSAQFPLHVWLPNAMEGPTPVSALLHAATMVAAGVFLIVRAYPLFSLPEAADTRTVMVWVGGFTALFAAILATVQTDIKRVLAYSTCSQLGYMICALGAGSLMAGYFHLTTHAFFKALLFLAAGSVIHAVHSNDMADMGGLFRKMKLTSTVFIIGALALAGVPGLSGFFSKDLILEAVSHDHPIPTAMLMAGAFLTAFYMGRVLFVAFFGAPSQAAAHAREGGSAMALPLLLLAAGTIVLGYFAGDMAALFGQPYAFEMHTSAYLGTGLGLAGLLTAWLVYGRRVVPLQTFGFLAPLGTLARSGAVDKFYTGLFHNVAMAAAELIGWLDRYIIDGVMNLIGYGALVVGQRIRSIQTGNVRDYVVAVVAGALALAVWGVVS